MFNKLTENRMVVFGGKKYQNQWGEVCCAMDGMKMIFNERCFDSTNYLCIIKKVN